MKGTRIPARAGAALLSALLLLSCAGCSEKALLFPELLSETVQSWTTRAEALEQSADFLGLGHMKEVAHDGGLTLYIHETTAELAVKTADGAVWYSNPQDRLACNPSAVGQLSSQVYISVISSAEVVKTMNSFDDCVRYGQFALTPVAGGVRVDYRFGQVTKTPLYPQALTAERFADILSRLDPEEQGNLRRYYSTVRLDAVTDSKSLAELKEKYGRIEELGEISVLKASPSPLETSRITAYLTKIGYTQEQRDADHAAVGYADPDKAKGNVLLPVTYTLEDGRLQARVLTEEIRVTKDLKLESIRLLPHFGTDGDREQTDLLLPDGSGAVVRLGRIVSGNTSDYNEPLYGSDYSLYRSGEISKKRNLYFPLYGLMGPQGALYAVAEEGDAAASLCVTPRTSPQDPGSAAFQFKLLDYATVKLLADDKDTVRSYPDAANLDPIRVSYTFLPREANSFMDIAADYRGRLRKEGLLPDAAVQAVPVVAQLLGAVDDTEPFLGVPREVLRTLTTYAQAESLTLELQALFGDSPLYLRYSGWRSGGIKSGVASAFDPESRLGGKKGFAALTDRLRNAGIRLFPDADFQYAYRDRLFDGFSATGDSARFVISESAYKPSYNPANFLPDDKGLYGYVVSPSKMEGYAAAFLPKARAAGLDALCLPYIGSELSGDFSKQAFTTRGGAMNAAAALLRQAAQTGMDLLTEGANAYALPYLSCAVNVSTESNDHPMIDRSVPFTQAVLSGSLPYAAEPLNTAADDRYYLLKCIETGSSLSFTAIAGDNALLKNTAYDRYYAVSLDAVRGRAVTVGGALADALAPVAGRTMTGYASPAEGVAQVSYDNGWTILVNYNDEAVVTPLGRVPATGYLQVKGE